MNLIHLTLQALQAAYIDNDDTVMEQLLVDPDLSDFVQYANSQYRSGNPVVSDDFYDNVLLMAYGIANPGSAFLSDVEPEEEEVLGKTVELPERMLSTNKAYSLDAIEKWASTVVNTGKLLHIDNIQFKVTPKLDGYASYYNGTNLYTRGNGRQGSDITRALDRGLTITNNTHGKGEIVVKRQWFSDKLSSKYENSRNIIASVIKEGELNDDIIETINEAAVVFVPFSELQCWIGSKEDLLKNIELIWDEFVSESKFDTDGLVIESIDTAIKEEMGFTNHHYKWQIAYKKNTEYHDVPVIGIIPQTSKTGRITPVVMLQPTKISGVTIAKATGHHYGNIIEKGIDTGAIVKVCRSGLVIPYIADVVKSVPHVHIPDFCPSCGHPTVMEGDNLLCINHHDCPAQVSGTLEFFFKTIGNCDGFGPKIVQQLCDGGVSHIVEIYRKPLTVLTNAGITGKTAINLVKELEKSQQIPLEDWRWLAAFSIPNIGKGGCEKLLKNHPLESIFELTIGDIVKIDGFAEKSATMLVETLAHIKPYIDELLPLFNLKRTVIGGVIESSISGKTVVFTGSLSVKRTDLEKQAKDLGAKVGSSVSSKTDYLIIGENVGATKIDGARKHEVKVLTELEYMDMIG
jgi:DNA ligase (NAD+)